jgi:hypothetical protein
LPYIDLVNEVLENYVVEQLNPTSEKFPLFYWDEIGQVDSSQNSLLVNFFNYHLGTSIDYTKLNWSSDDLTHKSFTCNLPDGSATIVVVRDIQTTRSGPCVPVNSSPGNPWPNSFTPDSNAPTNLTITATSPTDIDLSWNNPYIDMGPTQIIGFLVERSSDGDTWELLPETATNWRISPATNKSDTHVVPNTSYWYRVSSIIGYLQATTAQATIDYTEWDRQTCQFIILQNFSHIGQLDITRYAVYPMIQTEGTVSQLEANPQHTNVMAYETMGNWTGVGGINGNLPLDLPFSLWVEQARAYLKQLGTSLYEVMSTLRSNGILVKRSAPSGQVSLSSPSAQSGVDPYAPTNLSVQAQVTGVSLSWYPPTTVNTYHPVFGYVVERSSGNGNWTIVSNVYTKPTASSQAIRQTVIRSQAFLCFSV